MGRRISVILAAAVAAGCMAGAVSSGEEGRRSEDRERGGVVIEISAGPGGMEGVAQFPHGRAEVRRRGDELSVRIEGPEIDGAMRAARLLMETYQAAERHTRTDRDEGPRDAQRAEREQARTRQLEERRAAETAERMERQAGRMAQMERQLAEQREIIHRLERELEERTKVIRDLRASRPEREEEREEERPEGEEAGE